MFRLIFTAASILLCAAAASTAGASPEPVRVGVTFDKIYVPKGFDSNDRVQIVGEGMFRNTCYRPAPGGLKIDATTRTITVGPVAYEYSGFCLQVILPFNRVIDAGILKAGNWKVLQKDGHGLKEMAQIDVVPALTDSPDDYLYAPITQAFFEQDGLMSHVTLTGDFNSGCMSLETVKVDVQPEVIVLQPIAKMTTASTCPDGRFPFSKKVDLGFVPKGRYLLHVRSMNGNAVNTLVNVD